MKPGLILDDVRKLGASGFGEDWDEAIFGCDGLTRRNSWTAADAQTAAEVGEDVRITEHLATAEKVLKTIQE